MNKKNLELMEKFRKLTNTEILIIKYLLEHKGVAVKNYTELAKEVGKDKGNIRKTILGLEEKNLVVVRYKDEYAKVKQMIALKLVSDWKEKL